MRVFGTKTGRAMGLYGITMVGTVVVADDPMLAMRSIQSIQKLLNKADEQRKRLNQRHQSKLPIASTSPNKLPILLLNGNL